MTLPLIPAGMMELVDMRDLGDVTLVKGFAPSSLRTFFGKSRHACFYSCGSSVTLRLGFLTESKSEDNKKAADFLPFLSAPVVELADTMDLGDVTLMNVFSIVPRRGYSSVKAGSPVFINADQALRSASASSPSQNQRRIK